MAQTVPGMHEIIKQILLEEIERYPDFKVSDTPETDPTTSPDTPPRGTRPNNKEIA
jgi:hypothetical protein